LSPQRRLRGFFGVTDELGENPMSDSMLVDGRRWRVKAEEMRELAKEMDDQICKQTAFRIADDYERLAQRADQRAGLKNSNRDTTS
jgi:hypothetical protein